MPPRGPPKTREYDYSNVGKAGRRTGITLKEGKRDEHGMEEIDGLFSSPEKSAVKENGFSHHGNETMMGSDGMSMDEGNAPGPADFLNGINGERAPHFPPPKAGLTRSPRRTPGLRSSSPQQDSASPSPSASKGNRRESRHDASPLAHRSINTPASHHAQGQQNKGKGKTRAPAVAVEFSDSDENIQLNGDENGDMFDQEQNDPVDGFGADDYTGDQDLPSPDQNGLNEDSPPTNTREAEQTKPTSRTKANTSGKSRVQGAAAQNGTERSQPVQKRKGRGRPPKSARTADDEGDQRPSKKARISDHRPANANTPLDPELEKVVDSYAKRTGPLKGRSLYVLKREAPTDDNATHTRSGRAVIRPLAYWRNERCVYGDGEVAEGQRYPTATIKEIIRTEEREPAKKRTGKRSTKKSKSRRNADDESENEDEDHVDPWEKDGGVLHGYIRKWDSEAQAGMDEEEVLDLAYAPSGIETRDVKDSTFRFAKLLSSSFIGSGIVELPPGGVKKPKNSKKMHMVFYVCRGRVQIDISGVQFSAGKGCVFQVPRGNYYSFANTHNVDARLFFTQGCVPMENDGSGAEAAEPPEALESAAKDTEAKSTAKAGRAPGGKGRPRGKQKAGSKAS